MKGVALATAAGFLVRISYTLGSDFPLNDGGMFVVMTRDLQQAGFILPTVTSYNGLSIPYAYPPLAFYLAGAVASLTAIDLVELFRWLPLLLSTACIPAFALLARELLPPLGARAATFAYALVPASFAWLIMGGGLTRSAGLLCALLALAASARAFATADRRALGIAGIAAGLTALAHPTAAIFLAVGAVLFAARARTRDALARFVVIGAVGVVVATPWWLALLLRHGFAPLVAAGSGEPTLVPAIFTLLRWDAWYEPLFPLVSALALIGVVLSLARRDHLLTLWMALLALAVAHQFQMVSAVPLALLAGRGAAASETLGLSAPFARGLAAAAIAYLALAGILASSSDLAGLSPDERAAMAYVARSTPEGARVLVVTSQRAEADRTGEWLPALSGRQSVVTPQGTEWLPGGLRQRRDLHEAANACAQSDGDCLERLGVAFDYVYIPALRSRFDPEPAPCCVALADALRRDARYRIMYEGSGAVIFARKG